MLIWIFQDGVITITKKNYVKRLVGHLNENKLLHVL